MADHSVSTMTVRDCGISVKRAGAGPPMLMLHGSGGAERFLPGDGGAGTEFRCDRADAPGFGGSEAPPWLETVPDLANFYLDFLDALDLRNVHLVGLVAGRLDAADLAVRNASRLASLTLGRCAGDPCRRRAAARPVHAERRAGGPRHLFRHEARRRGRRPRARARERGCAARQPAHRREAHLAAALSTIRSFSAGCTASASRRSSSGARTTGSSRRPMARRGTRPSPARGCRVAALRPSADPGKAGGVRRHRHRILREGARRGGVALTLRRPGE